MTGLLAGKRLLITGVATKWSIAYAVAEEAQLAGAEVLLTSFGRRRSITERAARRLPRPADVLELDVNEPEHFAALTEELRRRWGGIDGALHAIAYAPPDALGGRFLSTPFESAALTFRASAFSFSALAQALVPLMRPERPASLVGLDFDATVAWPTYNWMGVCKASLEAISRYLARDLGGAGARVNLVAAGPLITSAASAIPGFEGVAESWPKQAPLGWDLTDPRPVARAVLFLLSDWASAITGEILHVDGGFHAMGTAPAQVMEEATA
jgi:enoyl-[acyl-carrier protein] reductase I